MKIHNHISARFSELEWSMVKHIPPGGNWKNIPDVIPSKRLQQIRISGGRTTYYGRLVYDKPSYTITTYFNRLGNGCNLHPEQDRVISNREAARLQSFRDSFVFKGSRTSQYKQIGNAVPPLLARLIANAIRPHIKNHTFLDLFAGAGGMSEGFVMNGYRLLGANEIDKNYFETFCFNHQEFDSGDNFILGDITNPAVKHQLLNAIANKKIGVIVGGPPCQGFSTAGWRDADDKRNQLFKDFVDVVDKIKPEFFVMENVLGILSMRQGEAIKEIIDAFKAIGYHVNSPIKLSAEEYGVPQKRKRVIIIGSLNHCVIERPSPLFSEKRNDLPGYITVRDAIASLPQITAGGIQDVFDAPQAISSYEKLMKEEVSFDVFYEEARVTTG